MAEALPSPPPLESTDPELQHESDELVQKLDSLLEQYLELLDQYTILREELSKTFSAGFFSLAQAQRTSTLGAGRRYGQDCYDQRMKAHRRVTASSDEEDRSTVYEVATGVPSQDEGLSSADEKEGAEIEAKRDSENVEDSSEQDEREEILVSKVDTKQTPAHRDPITWFGILVPPALRRTQSQFVVATEDIIPRLLLVQSRMRSAEEIIEDLRAQLESSAESEDMDDDETKQAERNLEQPSDLSITQQQKGSNSRRKLASRPAHSKAPLLQLDR